MIDIIMSIFRLYFESMYKIFIILHIEVLWVLMWLSVLAGFIYRLPDYIYWCYNWYDDWIEQVKKN